MPCLLQNSPRGWGREGMDSVQHTRQECHLHRVAVSIVNLIEERKLGGSFVNREFVNWSLALKAKHAQTYFSTTLNKMLAALEGTLLK